LNAETRRQAAQLSELAFLPLHGEDPAPVVHQFPQMGGLASHPGTEIENRFPGRGSHQAADQLGRLVLKLEHPPAVGDRFPQGLFRRHHDEAGRGVRGFLRPYPLLKQLFYNLFPGALQSVYSQYLPGGSVVGPAEGKRLFLTPASFPAVDEPGRMRMDEGGITPEFRTAVREGKTFPPALDTAQHGVYQGIPPGAELTGQRDRFMNGGMGGNPVGEEQLIEGGAENIPEEDVGAGKTTAQKLGEDPVQESPHPQGAVNQLGDQPPVAEILLWPPGETAVEQGLGKGAGGFDAGQDLYGR